MKKALLSGMLATALLTGLTVTANADSTSTGTIGFEAGSLIIDDGGTDLSTANLDFGSNEISNADKTYSNTNTTAQATVNDLRGSNAGWTLGVAQTGQFSYTDSNSKTHTLDNATMTLNGTLGSDSTTGVGSTVKTGVTLTPDNQSATLMYATEGNGNGKSIADISGSTLAVPGATVKVQGNYTTTLTWELTDGVTNG
ncbi:WxL domain-containing protein [Lactiplantibacillus mudanjiangensis]|uniref:WxL domain-containing protein [Lactobacillus sp.] n=1 Tax=Lactiplantibacillus mudanjiangensis TaxID=1296538 RepID=A0A660DYH0_9LACO|nr:WxL domain-containing protein [Lactiplantibacillus mudanjiangensis]VDG21275.1 WxL domain-containing protein [Lactobacillus sp.] [Lactiplantibacillus mudanjiangensis]VDG22465.1 WxL domain-containing protein [Lactobacillus sp.] [Lactiplantibacillus mudanjiangensis]VDG27002.1 WxL domain-containing protein [Lactobacillus sp.] [Lactiplantibacillus mudanjiangensis]VDG32102.1 WxL domain-containing protein [Lactobacillus sp.] [Lactiplantibacillus mudanjiangensis]